MQEYIPLPTTDFIAGLKAPVNLYIKLGEDKYVLLCKAGSKTNSSQLTSYKNKKINYLWTKKQDFINISKHNLIVAGIAVNSSNCNTKQKSKFLSSAANTVFSEMEHLGINESSYKNVKEITKATISLVQQNNNIFEIMNTLKLNSIDLVRHSLSVSTFSLMIAHELKWKNKVALEKLSVGALLHDIGLNSISKEILNKPIALMNAEELQIYESHPFKGMEMMMSLGFIPDDIISIIFEHEENRIGQGYPRKIRGIKMHPLARIVALADAFTNLVVQNVNQPMEKTPKEAIYYIEKIMGQPYDKEAFKALKKAIETHELFKTVAA